MSVKVSLYTPTEGILWHLSMSSSFPWKRYQNGRGNTAIYALKPSTVPFSLHLFSTNVPYDCRWKRMKERQALSRITSRILKVVKRPVESLHASATLKSIRTQGMHIHTTVVCTCKSFAPWWPLIRGRLHASIILDPSCAMQLQSLHATTS